MSYSFYQFHAAKIHIIIYLAKYSLEILFDGKFILRDEDFFEGDYIVLLVEDKHGFFVVDGVDCAEGKGAVVVGHQDAIADQTRGTLVAVSKWLDIAYQQQCKQRLFKYTLSLVDDVAGGL